MKLFKFIILTLMILLTSQAFADVECFIAKENNRVLMKEGNCDKRHAPYSTFKVALSLMGYDSGILIDEKHPEWPVKEGYKDWNGLWEKNQNPSTWISGNVIWYSQLITEALGYEKLKKYVDDFNYGNKDVSGDPGKNNGLMQSWLGSSLQISPMEQVTFIEKFISGKLPVSKHAQEMTHNILYCEELAHGWKLYSKAATVGEKEKPAAWDVGWIEKDGRHIAFVIYIEKDERIATPIMDRVRKTAKENLAKVIANLEKK